MFVKAYTEFNTEHTFDARDLNHAKEIAARIVDTHLWFIEPDGTQVMIPGQRIVKVKIMTDLEAPRESRM